MRNGLTMSRNRYSAVTRFGMVVVSICSAGMLGAQEPRELLSTTALTKDEQIEYHQRLERIRQAQLVSLSKQAAAHQQISAGYQQALRGAQALLTTLEREGGAAAAQSAALEQWKRDKAGGRAGCQVRVDDAGVALHCPATSPPAAAGTPDPSSAQQPPRPGQAPEGGAPGK